MHGFLWLVAGDTVAKWWTQEGLGSWRGCSVFLLLEWCCCIPSLMALPSLALLPTFWLAAKASACTQSSFSSFRSAELSAALSSDTSSSRAATLYFSSATIDMLAVVEHAKWVKDELMAVNRLISTPPQYLCSQTWHLDQFRASVVVEIVLAQPSLRCSGILFVMWIWTIAAALFATGCLLFLATVPWRHCNCTGGMPCFRNSS